MAGAKQLAGISVLLVAGRKHTVRQVASAQAARKFTSVTAVQMRLLHLPKELATLDDELSTCSTPYLLVGSGLQIRGATG